MADPKNTLYKKLLAYGFTAAIAMSGGYLIAPHEGKVNKTYLDPLSIVSSCYGHTGQELKLGQKFTDDQCYEQLAKDLAEHDKILMSAVKVPMTDYQHAAFLSFIYNVGPGKKGVKDGFVQLKKTGQPSTMLKKLNAGDYKGACDEFLNWMQKGQGLGGIETRRKQEREVCLGEIKIENDK